jgi:hypothetical protein
MPVRAVEIVLAEVESNFLRRARPAIGSSLGFSSSRSPSADAWSSTISCDKLPLLDVHALQGTAHLKLPKQAAVGRMGYTSRGIPRRCRGALGLSA